MHEISLCEGIRGVIEENARRHAFQRVKRVWLEIGALSCATPEAMRFAFAAVMRGSPAEQARLEIIEVPGRAWCEQCGRNVSISEYYDPCPGCGGFALRVTAGEELRVKRLEVE